MFPNVYAPSEDTFLLLDALEAEMGYLKASGAVFVCEIGPGSGVIINAVANILGKHIFYIASDINTESCSATLNTSKINSNHVEVINSDLLTCVNFKFDIILFNPPYVVTDALEMRGTSLNRAWAGGKNGRFFIDLVVNDLQRVLSSNGVCYMVILKENDPEDVCLKAETLGFKSALVLERKIIGEHLFVYKFFR